MRAILVISAAILATACGGGAPTEQVIPPPVTAAEATPSPVGPTRVASRSRVPAVVSRQFEAATVLQAQGRLAEAIDKYGAVIRLAPDFGLAYTNRGRAYIVLKQ